MLDIEFLGRKFSSPIVLASGVLGLTAATMIQAVKNGCGAVVVKSLSIEPRTGHPNPVMFGTKHYFINAVGLSNPGIAEGIKEIEKFKQTSNTPLIGSIFAGTKEEFGKAAAQISQSSIDFLEINVSCPNVSHEFGRPFAFSVEEVEQITKIVKQNTQVPVFIKLSPNASNIVDIALAAQAAGADAITAVNTIGGTAIDVRAKKPVLHNKIGGVSGPALFPIALKCVYDIYKAVNIPIIGTGGITTGEDALAMMMAGARLLGVGSAAYFRGPDAFEKINREMKDLMSSESITDLEKIIGCANEKEQKKSVQVKLPEKVKRMDKPQMIEITEIHQENSQVKTFYFDHPLGSRPGQFIMMWIPGTDQKPFSIGFDDGMRFGVSVFCRGPFTKKLFEMSIGDKVGISGPYGKGFSVENNTHYIMVAGGYGAAPLSYLCDKLQQLDNVNIDFIIGARSQDLLLYEDKLSRLKNLELHISTDDGSRGHKGFSTDWLPELMPEDASNVLVVTCGPELMEKTVLDFCNRAGVRSEISIERYMKCGVGVCGQCAVDDLGICLCTDGPVLPGELVNQIKEFGVYDRGKSGAIHYFAGSSKQVNEPEVDKEYKIGVFGSAGGQLDELIPKAHKIGRLIAQNKCILINGACPGLPGIAAKAASESGGEVWGYSPEISLDDHKKNIPDADPDVFSKLHFVPNEYSQKNGMTRKKYRNVISTAQCDAGIIISGRWGTLNEFTNLMDMGKVVGVLTGTGGFADQLQEMVNLTSKKTGAVVIFDDSVDSLISKIISKLSN